MRPDVALGSHGTIAIAWWDPTLWGRFNFKSNHISFIEAAYVFHRSLLLFDWFLLSEAYKCPSKTSKVLKFLQGSSMVLKSSQMSLKVLKGSQRSTKILKGPQMSQNVLNSLKQGFSKVHKSPQRCNKGSQRCLKVPKGVQSSLKVPKDAQRSLKFSEGHKIPFYSLSNISLNVRFPLWFVIYLKAFEVNSSPRL